MFDYVKQVEAYGAHGYFADDSGYIVWRRGTGDNVELLHLGVYEPGKGHGTRLLYRMLVALKSRPPYHSVFGFCLGENTRAQAFYKSRGFTLHYLGDSVYMCGGTVLFVAPYAILLADVNFLLTRLEPGRAGSC